MSRRMTDLSQLPGLPWPLSRVAYRSGGKGTSLAAAAGTPAAAAPAAAAVPAGGSTGRRDDVSVTVDGGRLVVSGGRLDVVLATVQAHLGSDAQLSQCDRSIVGGLGGFFGRERFTVIATPGADGEALSDGPGVLDDEAPSEHDEGDSYDDLDGFADDHLVDDDDDLADELEHDLVGSTQPNEGWSGPAFAEALSGALADLDATDPAVLAARLDHSDQVDLTLTGTAGAPAVLAAEPTEAPVVERSFAEELLGELFGAEGTIVHPHRTAHRAAPRRRIAR